MTDNPKKRKGGQLDYFFDALRDKVEPAIRSSRRSGSRVQHELAILGFCKAEHSKRLGYGFASARAIAAKVLGGSEAFDEFDPKDQASRVRLAQYHIAHIVRDADNFVVERGGRHAGQRNANRFWPAVDGKPIHKSYDAAAAARVASADSRYKTERDDRDEKRTNGLDRWRQRKGIPPKIQWAHDPKGILFGTAGGWRIEFVLAAEACWGLAVIGPDGARYQESFYHSDLDYTQIGARHFLWRVVNGHIEPSLTAEDAAEIALMR